MVMTSVSCDGGALSAAATAENTAMNSGLSVAVPGTAPVTITRRNIWSCVGSNDSLRKSSSTDITDSAGKKLVSLTVVMETTVSRTPHNAGVTAWRFTHTKPRIVELVLTKGFDAGFLVRVLEAAFGARTPAWAKAGLDLVAPGKGLPPDARTALEIFKALGLALNDVFVPVETLLVRAGVEGRSTVVDTQLAFTGSSPASKALLAVVPAAIKARAYDLAMCGSGKATRHFP